MTSKPLGKCQLIKNDRGKKSHGSHYQLHKEKKNISIGRLVIILPGLVIVPLLMGTF